ncbi:cysteine desulfurase sulfur acceptor subunit CsdE [Rosenbergiella sp. S61]|uniref:Cysteine desulfurase sulfur acceptor subunit CsdE n=1 Tax=Rosenbergiella gaditana TaxID=2726987 RepID=A0ABS5SU43_9GAMM|nr:cysteine desulfurase sulfur acceptor subunit CsdE [Rosenbergiella gaditana]MBT0723441.1 cysteine desulfurase sulfur acceptor subunit CsdE [Rosenbergiella gaditana]
MPLPTHPFGTAITAEDIAERLQKSPHWEDRYRELIRLSRQMPTLPQAYQTPENEVFGCENRVWVAYELTAQGQFHFVLESESRIVKGLLSVLLSQCEGDLPQALVDKDLLALFNRLGLAHHLSATRNSGLTAVAQAIKNAAHAALDHS